MTVKPKFRASHSAQEQEKRKRYFHATVITCIAVAMVFGAAHVVKLGANRMADMRSKASYDLKDERLHIRAAGEDIELHRLHEEQKKAEKTYLVNEIEALLPEQTWQEVDSEVLIGKGPFLMGTDLARADLYDQPQHRVNLPGYYIDKYPVTNAQYARFVVKTKHRPPLDWEQGKIPDQKALHPVTMVSWYDAKAYCESAGKRLPTEAEWEKAARGTDGRRWPWGEQMEPSRLNTYYNVGSTTAVTRYANGLSVYGVYDMAGNVSEWTASDFVPYSGSRESASVFTPKKLVAETPKDQAMKVGELKNLEGATYKVRRGGSWKSDPFSTSAFHRNFSLPNYASDFFGFRCVRDAAAAQR